MYYGEYELTELDNSFKVELNGSGVLEYKSQGYIYSGTFSNALPTGFCLERANSTIAMGNYIEGYLSGKGLILDTQWLKIGEFDQNTFISGTLKMRGEEIRMKSTLFENNLPSGDNCIVTYEKGNYYDGQMAQGERHGRGVITYKQVLSNGMEGSMTISADWNKDRIYGDCSIQLDNGVHILAHKNISLPNIEIYFKKSKEFSSQDQRYKMQGYDNPAWDALINNVSSISDLGLLKYLTVDYGESKYTGPVNRLKPDGYGQFISKDTNVSDTVFTGRWVDGVQYGECMIANKDYIIIAELDKVLENGTKSYKNCKGLFSLAYRLKQLAYISESGQITDKEDLMIDACYQEDWAKLEELLGKKVMDRTEFLGEIQSLFLEDNANRSEERRVGKEC